MCMLLLIMHTAEAAMILEYNGEQHNYTGSVYKLMVNGKTVATPLEPIIFNDRALVPVREVFEAMGAEVGYVASSKEVTVSMGETFVLLQIGSEYAFVNGERKAIPDGVTPMLIAKAGESAKTMVPVRFISESIGMNVTFDGANGQIKINNPSQSFVEETPSPTPKAYTSVITAVKAAASGNSVNINVTFNTQPEKIGELVYLDSSGVLYCDVLGANYTASNRQEVNLGAVTAVRLGLHDDYTRIAIDTSGVKEYYKKTSSDGKTLTITVTGGTASASPKPTATPTPTQRPASAEKIVVIDAGHGGSDGGAATAHDGIQYIEKNINLAVAKKVRDILNANGIRVEMTREGDTYPTLLERSELANSLGAAMFISIHSNSSADYPDASGIEVYYSATNNGTDYGLTSKALADKILKNLIKNTSAVNRGVKTAQHVVTRTCEMPAVLIELGFITNKDEALNLYSDAYQDLLAGAIADAVINTIGSVQIPSAAE